MTEKVQETAVENKREIKAEEIKNSAMRAAFIKSQEEKNKENISEKKEEKTEPIKTEVKSEKKEEPKSSEVELSDDDFTKKFNQKFGTEFTSIDEIKNFSKKEPTEEEKKRQAEIAKADFTKYYVEKGGSVDDVIAFENIMAKKDMDIVKEKFAAEQRKKNKDILQEDIDARFNRRYFINDENAEEPIYDEDETGAGQDKIANEAKEIRFNAGKKLTEAKSNYDNQRIAAQEGLKYRDSVAKILEKANTFDIKINDKEFVSFELTTERKAEVQKLVEEVGINSKIKIEELNNIYQLVVKGLYAEDMAKAAYTAGASKGTEKALEPFKNPIKQTSEASSQSKEGMMVDEKGNQFDPKTIGKRIRK